MTHNAYLRATGLPVRQASFKENDVFIVVDMQYDFLPGGTFAVTDGDKIVQDIVRAIEEAHRVGARVIYTRDYHPSDHVSFMSQGGPFPPHCKQGSRGSLIVEEISSASHVEDTVVFKGFLNCVDSFGAAPYSEDYAKGRISMKAPCTIRATGAYALYCSSRLDTDEHNLNAPPDLLSWKGPVINSNESLKAIIKSQRTGTVYVCGLALDYCVIDSAVNMRKYFPTSASSASSSKICIVSNMTRAASADPIFTKNVLQSTIEKEAGNLAETMNKYKIQFVQL